MALSSDYEQCMRIEPETEELFFPEWEEPE